MAVVEEITKGRERNSGDNKSQLLRDCFIWRQEKKTRTFQGKSKMTVERSRAQDCEHQDRVHSQARVVNSVEHHEEATEDKGSELVMGLQSPFLSCSVGKTMSQRLDRRKKGSRVWGQQG